VSAGAMFSSCLGFIQTVETASADLAQQLKTLNRKERVKFHRSP